MKCPSFLYFQSLKKLILHIFHIVFHMDLKIENYTISIYSYRELSW